MIKKISKILFLVILAGIFSLPVVENASACSTCGAKTVRPATKYVKYTGYQPEVIQPVVKNYDCSMPMPVFEPAPEMPVQPTVHYRPAPQRVPFIPNVSTYKKGYLKPLDDVEVARRNQVSTYTESRNYVRNPQPRPEFVMSSHSGAILEDDPCSRQGSIFGGSGCKRDKDGGILGGTSCKSCAKHGGGAACKKCKQMHAVKTAPAPVVAPMYTPMPAPLPVYGSVCPCAEFVPAPEPMNVSVMAQEVAPAPVPVGCPCANNYVMNVMPEPMPYVSQPCATEVQESSGAILESGGCELKGAVVKGRCCAKKGHCSKRCSACSKMATPCEKRAAPCSKCKEMTKPACVKKEVKPEVRDCSAFAPISLDWVDFRINRNGDRKTYSRNLGNYRFRIFGCRRNAKNTVLNEGRLLEKDMNFNEIFTDMVSDCYKIVNMQECIDENSVLPEYVLTAEITDVYLDVCDEYNWGDVRMENSRNGTSEMTVVWRLMDISKTNVLWKGETKGYGKLTGGEYDGETVLVQRAFADAASKLQNQPGFEEKLLVRLSKDEIEQQRRIIMEAQKASGICEPRIVEDSGIVSVASDIVDEVKVETPEPVASSAIFEADKLCIVERADVDNMGTSDVCKMRNSVVKIKNANGTEGAGLLISEQFVMTSADLIDRTNNHYTVETANGKTLSAKAFRANPRRNTALLVLSENAEYTPLGLNLELPAVGKDYYQFVGLKQVGNGTDCMAESEKVNSYRYTQDGAAEIMIDSFNQGTVVGGTLVDNKGRVTGIAHRAPDGAHLFLPMETAMRSLGVEICGKAFPEAKPQPKVWREPVSAFIDNPEAKAPEAMPVKNRK